MVSKLFPVLHSLLLFYFKLLSKTVSCQQVFDDGIKLFYFFALQLLYIKSMRLLRL